VICLNSFEERILAYLRENQGEIYTVSQIANMVGLGGTGFILERPGGNAAGGYSANIQMVNNALESLTSQGLVFKQIAKHPTRTETYYSVK
jgi:hypothetical protein